MRPLQVLEGDILTNIRLGGARHPNGTPNSVTPAKHKPFFPQGQKQALIFLNDHNSFWPLDMEVLTQVGHWQGQIGHEQRDIF